MTPPTVEQTRHLTRLLHNGQTNKAGKPYHERPERVAACADKNEWSAYQDWIAWDPRNT